MRSVTRRFLVAAALVGALAVLVVGPTMAAAAEGSVAVRSLQGSGERIRSFDANVVVNRDGSIQVTETIEYDFGGGSRHGIYRSLPVRYAMSEADVRRLDSELDSSRTFERVTPLTDVSVSSPDRSTPTQFEIEHDGGFESIKIGDPDRYVTGVHTYVIRYRLGGVLNGFDDYDELYLDVIGDQWDVGMDSVTATVSAPGTISKVRCVVGPPGSIDPCVSADIVSPTSAEFSNGSIDAHDAMSVVVAMP